MAFKQLGSLATVLKSYGFDLCAPFPVASYNSHCKAHHKIDAFRRPNPIGVLVGGTRHFWSYFAKWYCSLPPSQLPHDPIDTYTRLHVQRAVNQAIGKDVGHQIRLDFYGPSSDLFVHLQTAAHCAGVGHFDQETMWHVHPVYGLWHLLKAAIIFDEEFVGDPPPLVPPLLSAQSKGEMKRLTEIASKEKWANWKTRLAIRDACELGKEWRYHQDMLDYFYPISRTLSQVLADMYTKKNSNKS